MRITQGPDQVRGSELCLACGRNAKIEIHFLYRECFQPCLIYRLAEVPVIKMFSDRDFYLNHEVTCSGFLQIMLLCLIPKSYA